CDFDFNKTYGKWANDYIEVHHMKPISNAKKNQIETNPISDLTVVCSNCHRMIHKKRDVVLTVAELKKKLNKK
ncbi:MAG: HNH endonuclease, partial [Bacteroidia bacterium]